MNSKLEISFNRELTEKEISEIALFIQELINYEMFSLKEIERE